MSVWVAAARAMSPPRNSVWELVKEEIDGSNFSVPDDYEIGSGVSWWPARAARYPPDPTAIAYLLRRGERLILEVRMSSSERAGDAIDLIVATINALVGIVEHAILVPELFEGGTSAQGVAFPEDIGKIAEQQG